MTQRREAPAEVCYTCPGCGRGLTVFVALTGLPRCTRCNRRMVAAGDVKRKGA